MAISRRSLATLLMLDGRTAEVEPVSRRVLEDTRAALGDEHPDSLRATHSLAAILWRLQRPGEAEPLHRQAVEGLRSYPGHASRLSIQEELARWLRGLGRAGEALLFAEEVPEQTPDGRRHAERRRRLVDAIRADPADG